MQDINEKENTQTFDSWLQQNHEKLETDFTGDNPELFRCSDDYENIDDNQQFQDYCDKCWEAIQ